MKHFRSRPFMSKAALAIAIIMLLECVNPAYVALALTSGPGSPEFSSFEPVATTNMVNPLTGAFTYNIPIVNVPGPHGSGYPLSLSYHSGSNMDQEASWVGYGWTLNPGAINRSKRGFADDAGGDTNDKVKYYHRVLPSVTCAATPKINYEAFSVDKDKKRDGRWGASLSASKTYQYNNYQGLSTSTSFGLAGNNKWGSANFGIHSNGVETTYSASIRPIELLTRLLEDDSKAKVQKTKLHLTEMIDKKQQLRSMKDIASDLSGMSVNAVLSAISSVNTYQFSSFSSYTPFFTTKGTTLTTTATLQPTVFPQNLGMEVGISAMSSVVEYLSEGDLEVTGYLRNRNEDDLGDFFLEKDSPFTQHDIFVSPAMNNFDLFNVSGEQNAGTFRGYRERALQHYDREQTQSKHDIYTAGLDGMVGSMNGIGLDLSVGTSKQHVKPWVGSISITPSKTKNYHYRFLNDPGGSVRYTDNNSYEKAPLKLTTNNILSYIPESVNTDKVSQNQAMHIEEVLFYEELSDRKFIDPLAYDKEKLKAGAFIIKNPDGQRTVYGMPVFARNEQSIQIGYDSFDEIKNHTLAKAASLSTETDSDANNIYHYSGQNDMSTYASIYLMTQILGVNYVDIDNNGLDESDLGAWTKFSYRKPYTLSAKPNENYRWRIPYSGLSYRKNSISDPLDDIGSYASGEKEIVYLKAIETATHIAFFVTNTTSGDDFDECIPSKTANRDEVLNSLKGSQEDRVDGLGAALSAAHDFDVKNESATIEKLERVVLYSKKDFSAPLQETFFTYDNSLCKSLPNSKGGGKNTIGDDYTEESGKLTLTEVRTEHRGIKNVKVSPYKFSYYYKSDYNPELSNIYGAYIQDVINYGSNIPSNVQNPDYAPWGTDAWGNIQYDAVNRHKKMQPWVWQGDYDQAFDPAAWQLKHITLPSGGEINIQYEQADYSSVQDRNPMALVSLLDYDENSSPSNPEYIINPEDVGISLSDQQACEDYKDMLQDYFDDDKHKVYFKFLYSLACLNPSLHNLKSDYISGYASVSDVTRDPSTNEIKITLAAADALDTPREACRRFLLTNRGGKINQHDGLMEMDEIIRNNFMNKKSNADESDSFVKSFLKLLYAQASGFATPVESRCDAGEKINTSLSYLKIPLPGNKKGGGIRVKRLLMYDDGLESGAAVLTGTSYHYELENGLSSGVASNEPGGDARIENALVEFLPKKKQKLYSKLTSGRNLKVLETPIAESLLPAPMIQYARVVTQSIHSNQTNSGYHITEHYTSRDCPYDAIYKSIDDEQANARNDLNSMGEFYKWRIIPVYLGIFNFYSESRWLSQGFRFINYHLSGKTKKKASYPGYYDPDGNNQHIPSSYIEYDYSEPGEELTLWDGVNDVNEDGTPGLEEDFCGFSRKMIDNKNHFKIQMDIGAGLAGIIIIPGFSLFPSVDIRTVRLHTFTTSKVVQCPAYLKKTTAFQNGITTETENLAFSPYTGQPSVVRVSDPYDKKRKNRVPHDGGWYTTTIPACAEYGSMGQTALNTNNTNQLTAVAQTVTTYGYNPLEHYPADPFKNVVSSNVQTYKQDWSYPDDLLKDYQLDSDFNASQVKPFLPQRSYVYKDEITAITGSNPQLVDHAGYTSVVLPDFVHGATTNDAKWVLTEEIIQYSPHGEPLESKNILDIYAANRYSYSNNLISISAQNCDYQSLFFEDFEAWEEETNSDAHTGMQSREVKDTKMVITEKYPVTDQIRSEGIAIRMWVKNSEGQRIVTTVENTNTPMEIVANVNGWMQYYAKITELPVAPNEVSISLEFENNDEKYIDDIKITPAQASSIAFVYDVNTLQLLAQLDDQHFALIYQYDEEGRLKKKRIETERGIMTVQENHNNQKGEERSNDE